MDVQMIQARRVRDYQFHVDIAETIAPTWEKRHARIEEFATPVRQRMRHQLDPQETDTILELTAGVGDTGYEAAEIIGGSDWLLTRDFSPAMLDGARCRAELDLQDVDHRVIKAELIAGDHELVDGVRCGFGDVLPDPAAALAETRQVPPRRPGGTGRLGRDGGPPVDRDRRRQPRPSRSHPAASAIIRLQGRSPWRLGAGGGPAAACGLPGAALFALEG
jgi:hypothetical protein